MSELIITPTNESKLIPSETAAVEFGADSYIKIIHTSDVDEYEGDYDVTPKANAQTVLPTQDKLLRDNVTVDKVPYYQTSNEYGDTVYIAAEA